MSNNDLYCDKCKSQHHPMDCPLDNVGDAEDTSFNRVDLETELRADSDGMPVFRQCFDHERLMSFYDDDGAYEFETWWNETGRVLFGEHLININKEYLLD